MRLRRRPKQKSKTPRPGGRGALLLIGSFFALSAILRIADGAGPAIAREVTALASRPDMTGEAQNCQPPADIAALLSAMQGRQAALDDKEQALAEKEQVLALAEREVRQNMSALEAAEAKLSATISTAQDAAEGDLAKLTAVYENMKPKDAALLFEAMKPEFAAGFIGRMRPDAAASVMTGLTPEMAYSISVILAGRNADVPTE